MPIVVNVDLMLAKRKMRLNALAEKVGITPQNLSVLNSQPVKPRSATRLHSATAIHAPSGLWPR